MYNICCVSPCVSKKKKENMNDSNEDIVDTIDLTEMSFTIMPFPNTQVVIELLDDSVDDASPRITHDSVEDASLIIDDTRRISQIKLANRRNRKKTVKIKENSSSKIEENLKKSIKIVDCPICFEDLGRHPLVSTKCGHVFCQTCLERSLLRLRKCPTCRCAIKKASDYHPLYLTFGNPDL